MPGDITSEFTHGEFDRAPDPSPVGSSFAPGFSDVGARGDHVHAYGRMMGCSYQRAANFNVSPSTLGRIPWDIRLVDPQGFLTVLPASDLKVPVGCGGRYIVSIKLVPTPGGTITSTTRSLVHIISGGEVARQDMELGGYCSSSGIFDLNDGDIIAGEVFVSDGPVLGWAGSWKMIRLGPIQ